MEVPDLETPRLLVQRADFRVDLPGFQVFAGETDAGNRDPWTRLLTNYPAGKSPNDGVILRIANNSTDPVDLGVVDSQSGANVTLPVGKVLWLAGTTSDAGLKDSLVTWLRSELGGAGRLILNDPFASTPTAKVAYYDQNPSDEFKVGTEIQYVCPAKDANVILVVTVKRLQDPEDWMSEAEQDALSPKRKDPGYLDDWAVFSVSIDRMAPTNI